MSTENYVEMLRESLGKKISVLESLAELNRQQMQILMDNEATPDVFEDNVSKKEAAISQLSALDEGFETLFSRVRSELEGNRQHYADDIRAMQDMIVKITDLSARITRQEKTNYDLAVKKFSYIREQTQRIRQNQRVVTKYYQSMGRMTNYEPQFLDDKQ